MQGDWDERDGRRRIPSPLLPGLARLLKGLACAALWLRLSASFGPALVEGAWFHSAAVSVPKRCVRVWVWVCFWGGEDVAPAGQGEAAWPGDAKHSAGDPPPPNQCRLALIWVVGFTARCK